MGKALVIGFGSIGKLHANILGDAGFDTGVVSRHATNEIRSFSDIDDAVSYMEDYVVIASQTSHHESGLRRVRELGYQGKVLVEKPLFMHPPEQPLPDTRSTYVGYNLRYHPALIELRKMLAREKVCTVHHYVGQHLSQWRPGTDHKESYSANKSLGGGVLRDLSHELDLMQFLFGKPAGIKSLGGKFSDVTKDTEDAFGLLIQYEKCPLVTLQMNYLDHFGGRNMKVVCEDTSFDLDFVSGHLRAGDRTRQFAFGRETTYRAMHEDILGSVVKNACTYEEGMSILEQIARLEKE